MGDVDSSLKGYRHAGIVTILFTDLVGSSQIIDELGDRVAEELTRTHFRLLRDVVSGYGGHEVKSLGDGLMVVFPSAVGAVSCAIAMQQAVYDHNRKHPRRPMQVRIGLHAGEPIRDKADFFGKSIVIARRLCDSAEGGQIIVSDLAHNIVVPRGAFEFTELGSLALKGIAAPMEAHEVLWDPNGPRPTLMVGHDDAEPAGSRQHLLRKRLPVVAAAVVALVALVIVASVVLRDSEDGTVAPTGRAPLEAGLQAEALVWKTVTSPSDLGGSGDQLINRVATDGDQLIAVGESGQSLDSDAAVWRSTDGLTWKQVSDRDLRAPGDQVAWAVTFSDELIVAAGSDNSSGEFDAAVWTSENGVKWTRTRGNIEELGGEGDQLISRVAVGERGFVAVGSERVLGEWSAAAWVSADGKKWTQAPTDDADLGGSGRQEMRGVAIADDQIVAVGSDESSGTLDAAVWVSRNGLQWKRLRQNEEAFGRDGEQVMTSVVAGEDGFVAVGWDTILGSKDAAAWTSSDGTIWKRSSVDEEVLGGRGKQVIFGLDRLGDGLVAVGLDTSGGGGDAAVWTSRDGERWLKVAGGEDVFGGDRRQTMRWVLPFGPSLIGAGWSGSPGDFDGVVWVGTPAG